MKRQKQEQQMEKSHGEQVADAAMFFDFLATRRGGKAEKIIGRRVIRTGDKRK